MRRYAIGLAIAVVTLAIVGCSGSPAYQGSSKPPAPARPVPRWELVQQQYGPSQLARWSPAPWPRNNNGQIACYAPGDVSAGTDLLMRITPRPCDGMPESGAWLQSRVMWSYGTFAARIYLPASPLNSSLPANWPAFWLEDPNQWPVNGEIDIMEVLPSGRDCQQVHYGPAPGQKLGAHAKTHYCLAVTPGWHVFSVTWSPAAVKWYIDGHFVGMVTSHVPHHTMQIVLDYTSWPGEENSQPATMRVAWVRVNARALVG